MNPIRVKKFSNVLLLGTAWILCLSLNVSALAQSPDVEAQARPAYHLETGGQAQVNGKRLRYRAEVHETFITDDKGQRTASLVSTSYFAQAGSGKSQRPVVFVFNGGPGSAGLWLQMGLVGPRRVDFDDAINPPTVPPYRLTDNADSILDVADVVIFDPPGTGFSRIIEPGQPKDFYGVRQDAKVTLQFIEDWIQRHNRWNSPRFLLGESYGSVRAAVVAKLMAGGPFGSGSMNAITLNGVILLGQALGAGGGETGLANSLPSLTATAWYHSKLDDTGQTLEEWVSEAQAFASTEYITALYAGSRLDESEQQRLASRIAVLTGLPVKVVLENQLRVSNSTFARELLSDQGQQVGAYDSRFLLPLAASGGDPVADDPAMAQYVPAFVAAVNMHLRDELGVTLVQHYLPIEFHKVNGQWDYGNGPGVPSQSGHAEDLAVAMRRNPKLELFIGTGYYDLVTTVGSAEYTAAHADFPAERVILRDYASGHMPYLGNESRRQLAADLRRFITTASGL